MSCGWPAATPGVFGIIRNWRCCMTTCCARPRSSWPRARPPNAPSHDVDPGRIALGGGFVVPENVFTPLGPALDPTALTAEVEGDSAVGDATWGSLPAGLPYFGVYGKLGDSKGSFALLSVLARLKQDGVDVGLVALAHGRPPVERRFRATARDLGIADRVLQLPFLPNWRVPEFIRGG